MTAVIVAAVAFGIGLLAGAAIALRVMQKPRPWFEFSDHDNIPPDE